MLKNLRQQSSQLATVKEELASPKNESKPLTFKKESQSEERKSKGFMKQLKLHFKDEFEESSVSSKGEEDGD